ncbi:MAG TPA: hypothetical protein PKD05_23880 [Candidatus Melainabacteria bacterium]|nr:hypothetical protein [Candidatus Melainabacteria bacterium]HMP54609.1 hypothetical protein [Candidatus Melainabacteria bacterium]
MFKAVADLSSRSMATVAVVLVCVSIAMGMCFSGGFVFTIALLIYGALPASALLMWMERKDFKRLFWLPIVLSLFYAYCRLALGLIPADYRMEPILDANACCLPLVGFWLMPVPTSSLRITGQFFKSVLIGFAALVFFSKVFLVVVYPVVYEDFSEQIGYRLSLISEEHSEKTFLILYRDTPFLPGILQRDPALRSHAAVFVKYPRIRGRFILQGETMFVDRISKQTHMFE